MYFRVLCLLFLFAVAMADVVELSCDQIQELVDGHNNRRLSLATGEVSDQPAASQMNLIVWDKELEQKATEWVGKEEYGHNPNRNIPSGRFTTGENIYWLGTTDAEQKFDLDQALRAWWDEYKYYTFKPLCSEDFQSSQDIGHYTQMAWSDSTYLGCGLAKYWRDSWLNYYVVCNYGPAGNILGQKIYAEGDPSNQLDCGISDCSQPYGSSCSG